MTGSHETHLICEMSVRLFESLSGRMPFFVVLEMLILACDYPRRTEMEMISVPVLHYMVQCYGLEAMIRLCARLQLTEIHAKLFRLLQSHLGVELYWRR